MINIEEEKTTEDYIFGKSFGGGSKVETLPGDAALGEDIHPLCKMARAFRGAQSANNYVDRIKYNA